MRLLFLFYGFCLTLAGTGDKEILPILKNYDKLECKEMETLISRQGTMYDQDIQKLYTN